MCNKDETIKLKKDVYEHLIKTTNVVRNRNRELEKERSEWKNRLIKTKKLNRKQKKLIRECIYVALNNDNFCNSNYDECMKLLKFLK